MSSPLLLLSVVRPSLQEHVCMFVGICRYVCRRLFCCACRTLLNSLVQGSVLLSVAQVLVTLVATYLMGLHSKLYYENMKETCDFRRNYAGFAANSLVAAYAFKVGSACAALQAQPQWHSSDAASLTAALAALPLGDSRSCSICSILLQFEAGFGHASLLQRAMQAIS
jgi:hypothetical protein